MMTGQKTALWHQNLQSILHLEFMWNWPQVILDELLRYGKKVISAEFIASCPVGNLFVHLNLLLIFVTCIYFIIWLLFHRYLFNLLVTKCVCVNWCNIRNAIIICISEIYFWYIYTCMNIFFSCFDVMSILLILSYCISLFQNLESRLWECNISCQ